jgi:hypothetical protein
VRASPLSKTDALFSIARACAREREKAESSGADLREHQVRARPGHSMVVKESVVIVGMDTRERTFIASVAHRCSLLGAYMGSFTQPSA